MPGGRLTHEDRRRVADGLAEGLTYTEIARLLGRPVSTVSREVIRNGGPGGYDAERAHRATAERARRRAPASPSPAAVAGRDPGAVYETEEELTAVLAVTGLPRMTARVLACLYVTDSGSLTVADLVRRLRVSPASISKAVAELEAHDLIRRERDPRRRRDRYVIDDDAWYRAWRASARRNATLAEAARRGAGVLGPSTSAGMRLDDMSRFLDRVCEDMLRAGERWWKDRREGPRRRGTTRAPFME
ncbi:MarR family transcriptional regulator [Nonomuraea pusilla]|uniref:Helix-turn-helix domain-containing protein n=1 Tax=Nonomuraea pusilla TaxID=46177 RepID=A0A1H8CHV4_9ACTN|nr:MarR family transcriptional regulator [Nonomuraea pusilla]SEM94489.1 Helix-turn-helix domain-containing protein [Nonomuraea pusilla]